jgi:hypothetical protein
MYRSSASAHFRILVPRLKVKHYRTMLRQNATSSPTVRVQDKSNFGKLLQPGLTNHWTIAFNNEVSAFMRTN